VRAKPVNPSPRCVRFPPHRASRSHRRLNRQSSSRLPILGPRRALTDPTDRRARARRPGTARDGSSRRPRRPCGVREASRRRPHRRSNQSVCRSGCTRLDLAAAISPRIDFAAVSTKVRRCAAVPISAAKRAAASSSTEGGTIEGRCGGWPHVRQAMHRSGRLLRPVRGHLIRTAKAAPCWRGNRQGDHPRGGVDDVLRL